MLLLYVLAGWGILAGLMVAAVSNVAVNSWINQWILRKGGEPAHQPLAKCLLARSTYQSRHPGLAMASLLTTFSSG